MVKRFSVYLPHYETGEIEESPDGEYVLYTDYAALAERCERLEADAKRYQWLKMTAPPGTPIPIFEKMHQALDLLRAYEVFCTSWTGWDKAIDEAMEKAE